MSDSRIELAERLSARQREEWREGERTSAEDYLVEQPSLQDAPEAFALIYGEFLLREELGEEPSLEEYQRRFPCHAARLERQVQMHRLFASVAVPRPEVTPAPTLHKWPGPAVPAHPAAPAFPSIEGYEVLGELGRGGMGVVYKARQLGLNRIVALKMLRAGPFADPAFLARFRSEAEAVARLQHPNIVQIFAAGTHSSLLGEAFSCPYFAQEYVDGGNLAERLNSTPQPPRDAAHLVEILARAVHYAHEHGIVHRDLKPANILLTVGSGEWAGGSKDSSLHAASLPTFHCPLPTVPKIADFGLAKQLGGSDAPTISSMILGTPEYMAPEQAAGEKVGPVADVYALGVILYEAVTGRRPFEGPTPAETLEQVRNQEPVSPRRLQPRIPRDVETMCLKCLRKEPHLRYASALALADDLHRFLQGKPIQARPASIIERVGCWARRRPDMAFLALVLVLTALGGVVGITAAWLHALAGWGEADQQRHQAVTERSEADAQRERAQQEQARAVRRQEEAESGLYFSRVAQARLERMLNNTVSAERLLEQCRPQGEGAADRRGWEWFYLQGVLHADLLTLRDAHEGCVSDLAFSPDGERLVTVGGSPFAPQPPDRVRVWQAWGQDAGKCLREFPQPRWARRVKFSTDGRRIAWARNDGTLTAANPDTGAVLFTRQLPTGYENVGFSNDGQRYAACDQSGRCTVWDLESGQELFSFVVGGSGAHLLAFSPDNRQLADFTHGTLRLWDLEGGHETRTFPQADNGERRPVFSPDGRLLAQGTSNGMVRLWDVRTGQLLQSPAGHAGSVLATAFSPDGRQLATAGADGTVGLWEVATGVELLRLRGHQGRVGCLSFHPSGRYLASGSEQPGDVKVWDLTRHQEYVTVNGRPTVPGRPEAIGFADGGETVLAARATGRLQRSDAATGMDRAVSEIDLTGRWLGLTAFAAFRADGGQLAAVSRASVRIVQLIDVATGEATQRLEHSFDVLHIAYSADGRRLATCTAGGRNGAGPREVSIWDTATGQQLAHYPCEPCKLGIAFSAVALSPDGSVLAYGESVPDPQATSGRAFLHRIRLRDAATGEWRTTLDGLPGAVAKLVFCGAGRYLAVACDDQGVTVYDLRANRWLHQQPLDGSSAELYFDLAFSPDGKRLAATNRVQVLVWDADSGQLVLALRGAPPRPSDNGFNPRIVWSPDGRRLAVGNWNTTVSIWSSDDRHTPAAKQSLHRSSEERARKP